MQKRYLLFVFLIFAVVVQGKDYKRIVSLAPSLTQSIYYLSAQDLLVGCTSYCEAAKKDDKPIVSSAIKVNLEKLLSLKPDLVVASGLLDADDLATLRKFGIKVEVFYTPKSFDEICQQFSDLGKMIGKTAEAEKIISESKRKIDAIVLKRKAAKTKTKMFFQIGADPIFTVLPNTFMNDYITFLGASNISSSLKTGTVGREFVIARNPDYIFIATMGVVGETERNMWLKYRNLAAAKKKRVFIVDSEIACQPTPITFVQTMEVLDKWVR